MSNRGGDQGPQSQRLQSQVPQVQNLKNLHEMVFVYNAVMDGWTVRRLRNGKIRFKKKTEEDAKRRRRTDRYVTEHQTRRYDLELEQFIRTNTQVSRVFTNQ